MNTPRLPAWVAPICCVTPFMALVGFSVTAGFGASVGTPVLVCLIILCGKIISSLLNGPNVDAQHPTIENSK